MNSLSNHAATLQLLLNAQEISPAHAFLSLRTSPWTYADICDNFSFPSIFTTTIATMLQSFGQSQDWLYTEPLFDDDFYQNLVKNLESLPTPPQSPPMKASETSDSKPLSKEDQLSYVSNILLEDCDMQALGNWNLFEEKEASSASVPLEDGSEDFLWKELGKGFDEKLVSSMLSSSPLLSDIDTSIFEEIAGSTLDCQALMDTPEGSEVTSDCGSTGGELSNYSSSDSEEEIDVVTVVRCPSSPSPLPSLADIRQREQDEAEKRRIALQRHNAEIQQQHNYAAPCPASPPPSHAHKRSRDGSVRHHSHRNSSASSTSSRFSSRNSMDMEDDEERRRTHNVMERQRRNELKNCFMHLRDNVPELTRNEKASKVVILKKARDCIFSLEDDAHRLQKKRDQLRARQEELKARLTQLRS